MAWIIVDGARLEYKWIGPPPDQTPTIVFLHRGLGSTKTWKDFPLEVSEATGFGALIYSRAGYGNSDPKPLPWPTSFMHDEALAVLPDLLEQLGIHDAILFGHSDGGSIALIHAGSESSETVHGLVLEAPHVFVEDISIESVDAVKVEYEQGELKPRLEKYHGQNTEVAFRGWNDTWLSPEFRSWNIEEYLPGITVPVLLIQGVNDEYGTLAQVEAIEKGVRGPVEKLILEECGHNPHRDQREKVLESTVRFIKRIFDFTERGQGPPSRPEN